MSEMNLDELARQAIAEEDDEICPPPISLQWLIDWLRHHPVGPPPPPRPDELSALTKAQLELGREVLRTEKARMDVWGRAIEQQLRTMQ